MAEYSKEDCGDTIEFRDMPPKVYPDGSDTDAGYPSIAPLVQKFDKVHDTYQKIPGDGVVPG